MKKSLRVLCLFGTCLVSINSWADCDAESGKKQFNKRHTGQGRSRSGDSLHDAILFSARSVSLLLVANHLDFLPYITECAPPIQVVGP